ncbi:helix-turn-helix domain-containing protein [Patescibacteria group bacterium]|nr:helix-turn-helix domain-containing protein [Patescibacteria group bacterium]MBU1563500.1 helix-turn-helix domain-containing protein [Patescibacteria group bacterium]
MNKLFTPKQIANKLGVSEFTIWRYIKAGKLKAIKLTKRNFRIEQKDLNQFLKKHKTK